MAFAVALGGCSTVGVSEFDAEAPWLPRDSYGSVKVAMVPRPEPMSQFHTGMISYDIDLDELSGEIARLLSESLTAAGAAQGGSNVIHVQADYIEFVGNKRCLLDYRIRLGDGGEFGLQSIGESAMISTACGDAIENAVHDIARDPRTVEFLRAR